MQEIGRNDPCPCGSGKKYKRCHLPLGEQQRPAVREPSAAPAEPALPADVAQLQGRLREISKMVPRSERADFDRLLAQVKPITDYMARQEQIEGASEALEAHRAEFEKLMGDGEAVLERAHALFAEEGFAPLRFTAADIKRAFETVGFPQGFAEDERVVQTLRAAILHLADKDRRTQLSMRLLLHLPDYVAAGRHMDGWLIQHCAHLTAESDDESNPFLFEMFSHGYRQWQEQRLAEDDAMIQQRLQASQQKLGALQSDTQPDAAATEAIADFVRSLTQEMAPAMFTPQRTARLVEQLKSYRERLHAAGDQQAFAQAQGALVSLQRETEPARNPFINALCFVSLRAMLDTMFEHDTP